MANLLEDNVRSAYERATDGTGSPDELLSAVRVLVRDLKRDPATRGVPVAGYYAHVDQETRRAAEAAGVDPVLPRSAFTARLAQLLTGAAP